MWLTCGYGPSKEKLTLPEAQQMPAGACGAAVFVLDEEDVDLAALHNPDLRWIDEGQKPSRIDQMLLPKRGQSHGEAGESSGIGCGAHIVPTRPA
jgi:hypothetical protein